MKVLVTGGFGNIGSHCLPYLIDRGHQVRCVELRNSRTERVAAGFTGAIDIVWGNICDVETMDRAVEGREVVVHLAAVIPPESDEKPGWARQSNVDGTRNVIEACQHAWPQPRLFFASTFDLFGYTQHLDPPRRVTDPICPTNGYTEHKAACEEMIHQSGLAWLIARFSDVPIVGLRSAHPIMFDLGPQTRFELVHPSDAGLAIANALECAEAWGKILLIGGGPRCQTTYREFVGRLLTAMGIGPFPDEAFNPHEYCTDWLDTEESQRLLQYQRHSFDDIVAEVAACLGWRRYLVPLVRPFMRWRILRTSKYWAARNGR